MLGPELRGADTGDSEVPGVWRGHTAGRQQGPGEPGLWPRRPPPSQREGCWAGVSPGRLLIGAEPAYVGKLLALRHTELFSVSLLLWLRKPLLLRRDLTGGAENSWKARLDATASLAQAVLNPQFRGRTNATPSLARAS